MRPTRLRRIAVGALATVLGLSLALPAPAAETEGPDFYQGIADSSTLELVVGLPSAIVEPLTDALDPALSALGISLADNKLTIDLSLANVNLEKLTEAAALGLAEATPLGGSLQGLVESLAGDALKCLDTPIDVAIPSAEAPLVSLTLLSADCDDDASDGIVSSTTKVADLSVDLKGLLALLPAELAEAIDDTLETVENDVLAPVIDGVNEALGVIGDEVLEPITGGEVQLDDILKTPDLVHPSLPLLHIGLIEATTRSVFDGAAVTATSSTTIADVNLLNLFCMVTDDPVDGSTFVANATAYGESTDYSTVIPEVTFGVCGDNGDIERTILKLTENVGVIEDVLVNIGGGDLSLIENLENSPLPLADVLNGLNDALQQLGVYTVLAGSQDVRAHTKDFVEVAVIPASVTFLPLNGALAGTPLEDVRVDLFIGSNVSSAFGTVVLSEAPPAPEPVEPNLPRTGGGAIALLLGSLAIGGSALLRRR
ncbi:MAG: hypothetical protein R3249_08715 [Nitriliruptorales bacterium]|nr:hypothetical protein [Nitriliruptorales bacterium]